MRHPPLLLLTLLLVPCLQAQTDPLSEDEKIHHVLSRLTFGPRPGDVARVRQQGLDAWLAAQFEPQKIADDELQKHLAEYATLWLTPAKMRGMLDPVIPEDADPKTRRMMLRDRAKAQRELPQAILLSGAKSERQLFEVMTNFWRNHFNVDLTKSNLRYTTTHYEKSVIRDHTFGRFEDMLSASAHHPAMLVYLDNALSRKAPPKSVLRRIERQARKRTGSREMAEQEVKLAEQRGLNENYARELMELHTLGVDNGYSQRDVEMVAKAFTGWSIDRQEGETWFKFRQEMHDDSQKFVMGKALPPGGSKYGQREGEAILKRLAHHENTAGFIAKKMVTYLVSDEPVPAIEKEAARAFRRTKGDLKAVVKAIVEHPEFFERKHFRGKFKTPFEFVISAVRALGAEVKDPRPLVQLLVRLQMPIYRCEDPTGYRDTAESWRDPGVMAIRWQFAIRLAKGRFPGVQVPTSFYYGLPEDPLELSEALAARIVPQGLGPATRDVLDRVIFRRQTQGSAREKRDIKGLAVTITGILLGCPEFQQQ